jgi:hypothetical protein
MKSLLSYSKSHNIQQIKIPVAKETKKKKYFHNTKKYKVAVPINKALAITPINAYALVTKKKPFA